MDDESLALEAIRQVGPGGNYLANKHTLKHMRELWQPALMDRRSYSAWEQKKDGARQWALAKAQGVLKDYHSKGVEEKAVRELNQIIKGFEF